MEKEEAMELVIKAGGGAIGPVRVAFEMLTDPLVGRIALEAAIEADITGGELWLLYKDVHGEDLGATREALCLKQALGELQQLRYSKHYRAVPE